MNVDKKYYRRISIQRTLPANAKDLDNSILSCGFIPKGGGECFQKNIEFTYYGGLYVISGTGRYVDAETGREYPVYPGCILQRMPGKRHHTFIDEDSGWLEFYFCGGAHVFDMLVKMKLVTDEPIFYAGESMEIFTRLTKYYDLFSRTDNDRSPELLFEFQKLLCYLNTYRTEQSPDSGMREICDILQKNYRVGIPLEDIAAQCAMSYENLRKKFRVALGCSISQYLIDLRINKSKDMLLSENMSIQEVAAELGYCDTYAFCHQFKQRVGVSPGKYVAIFSMV